jgi:hypothetical protein
VKFSRCIAAALLALVVASMTAGCSSCAKDDAAPAPVPSDTPPTALTDRKASPLPRHFERRNPPGIENLAPTALAPAAADAGVDAAAPATPTTH